MATPATSSTRLWVIVIAILVLGIFIAANAHFFYVAFDSAPDCVPHEKLGAADASRLSAADSSC